MLCFRPKLGLLTHCQEPNSHGMQHLIQLTVLAVFLFLASSLGAQESRPAYCDNLPTTYEKGANSSGSSRPSLPRFGTTPTKEYKVQVAILRNTDPSGYPFHEKLIARYRPCEEVWVLESRESFASRSAALSLRNQLRNLGYLGAYLVECIGYQ